MSNPSSGGSGGDSKDSSSSSTSTTAVLAALGAAAAIGLGYIGYSYHQYNKQTEQKKLHKPKPAFKGSSNGSARSTRSGDSADSKKIRRSKPIALADLPPVDVYYQPKSSDLPPAKDLIELVAMAFNALRTHKKPGLNDGKLLDYLRQTPTSEYGNAAFKDRLTIAQFILAHHGINSQRIMRENPNESEIKSLVIRQTADVKIAWNLLQVDLKTVAEPERAAADLLMLDFATRMRDGKRLNAVFERVIRSHAPNLSPSASSDSISFASVTTLLDLVQLFVHSAYCGRWRVFRSLGERISEIKGPRALEEFHQVSFMHPSPDFSHLYTMAESEAKQYGDANVDTDLKWTSYTIQSMKMKLISVESNDTKMSAHLRQEFALHPDGKEMAEPDGRQQLVRTGAYARIISPQQVDARGRPVEPIRPLIGPATATRMTIGMVMDVDPRAIEREEYVLKLVPPAPATAAATAATATTPAPNKHDSTWVGTYTTHTVAESDSIKLVMSVVCVLREDDIDMTGSAPPVSELS